MPTYRIQNGDCRDELKLLAECSVDSVVTDPPYELGFMGKVWDRSGIAYQVEVWRECLRVLKPGGHLLAFGGSRTYHRLACAIEDAGFEIRDQIQWLYGSGFPKSLDVSKAIDRLGPNREFVAFLMFAAHYAERRKLAGMTHAQICELGGFYGTVNHGGTSVNWELGLALPTVEQWEVVAPVLGLDSQWRTRVVREQYEREIVGQGYRVRRESVVNIAGPSAGKYDITSPTSDAAKQWNGWGTALKPAHEPIVLARKPLIGTVAENVLRHGTGGLNIDGCRIETAETIEPFGSPKHSVGGLLNVTELPREVFEQSPLGRWPANVIHDGSEEVLAGFPNAGAHGGQGGNGSIWNSGGVGGFDHGDSGSAARFFYCAKASQEDRSDGCEDLEFRVADTSHKRPRTDLDDPRRAGVTPRQNNHPTVKPTQLMRYLCRLVTPPNGTVLDPFCGSGSTGRGAILEGLNFIGIEIDAEYCELAEKRIEAVTRQGMLMFA